MKNTSMTSRMVLLAAFAWSGFCLADGLAPQNHILNPDGATYEFRADQVESLTGGWQLTDEEIIEQLNTLPPTAAGGIVYDSRVHWKRERAEMEDVYRRPAYN